MARGDYRKENMNIDKSNFDKDASKTLKARNALAAKMRKERDASDGAEYAAYCFALEAMTNEGIRAHREMRYQLVKSVKSRGKEFLVLEGEYEFDVELSGPAVVKVRVKDLSAYHPRAIGRLAESILKDARAQ